jgi:hypothetical protein
MFSFKHEIHIKLGVLVKFKFMVTKANFQCGKLNYSKFAQLRALFEFHSLLIFCALVFFILLFLCYTVSSL